MDRRWHAADNADAAFAAVEFGFVGGGHFPKFLWSYSYAGKRRFIPNLNGHNKLSPKFVIEAF